MAKSCRNIVRYKVILFRMKRRNFLKLTGASYLVGIFSPPYTYASKPVLINRELRYIDPRLQKKYEVQFSGEKIFTKNAEVTGKNILLITSDQHHYMCMGYNNPKLKTPNLDRLAKMGIIFDRAYCSNPTSTPTRATIITGKYASQHGAWALGTKLSETVPTVGDYFQKAGYRTALIGKAHFQPLRGCEEYPSCESYPILQDLDFWRKYNGPFYGFEHVELTRNHTDEAHVGQHYGVWLEEKGAKDWRNWFRKPTGNSDPQHHVWNIPEKYHYNNWITERTNEKLEEYKHKKEHFFLWASFFDPHPSYLVPEPWASMYKPEDMHVPEFVLGEFDDKPVHFKLARTKAPDFSYLKEDEDDRPHWVHGAQSHLSSKEKIAKNMATYYGMISMLDHYIGKILDKLEDLDLLKDTAIIFTTDHGHFLGEHGLVAKAIHHYEDLLRIPCIVAMPGGKNKGTRSQAIQSTVDLAQSFLSIAGIKSPMTMAGIDQSKVWNGELKSARAHAIVENHFQPTKFYAKSYINERYKLTVYMNQTYGELFDLKKDPLEMVNLWDDVNSKELKMNLLLELIHADQAKEPLCMPRIALA